MSRKIAIGFLISCVVAFFVLEALERIMFERTITFRGRDVELPKHLHARFNSDKGTTEISYKYLGRGNYVSIGGDDALTEKIVGRIRCETPDAVCGFSTGSTNGRCGIVYFGDILVTAILIPKEPSVLIFHNSKEDFGRVMFGDFESMFGKLLDDSEGARKCFGAANAQKLFTAAP